MADSICPGCGLRAEPGGIPLDRPFNASPECWALHAEMLGFELAHPDLVRRFHQLAVDAYGAQHAGPPTTARSVVYGLVGLELALEDGWTGVDVRTLHARMGPVQPSWPVFGRPLAPAGITVLDVVLAGVASRQSGRARERGGRVGSCCLDLVAGPSRGCSGAGAGPRGAPRRAGPLRA